MSAHPPTAAGKRTSPEVAEGPEAALGGHRREGQLRAEDEVTGCSGGDTHPPDITQTVRQSDPCYSDAKSSGRLGRLLPLRT